MDELIRQYEQEYKRVNGKPVAVVHVGSGWYRLRAGNASSLSWTAYRHNDLEQMLERLRERPDAGDGGR